MVRAGYTVFDRRKVGSSQYLLPPFEAKAKETHKNNPRPDCVSTSGRYFPKRAVVQVKPFIPDLSRKGC